MDVRDRFIQAFQVTDVSCDFAAANIEPSQKDICAFAVPETLGPAGPFLTAQLAYFIPKSKLESAMHWFSANKGNLDIFIHPNSGCSYHDHVDFSVWGGNKWEIDSTILSS